MMKRLIGGLRQLGARAALDNVGGGFVNLSAIGEIGVAYLKIDGAFTESLIHQGSGQAVLRTLTVLAHELGIASVAKSVQSDLMLPALERIGVDYGQGQALGAPMPLPEFEKLAGIAAGVEHSEAFVQPQVTPLAGRKAPQQDIAHTDALEPRHR